jgi:Uma2 family endonuclease
LIFHIDDGIVVVMTTEQYLYDTEETSRIRELRYGVLREPPAPFYGHQHLVLRIARLLADHVEPRLLGVVGVAPLDVILDRERALIVQPDVLFVASARQSIIRNQVWGAPDLVVEVLSTSTKRRDRGQKLRWYRQYGVRECWLVEPANVQVVVIDCTGPRAAGRIARGTDRVSSTVLPEFDVPASRIFD